MYSSLGHSIHSAVSEIIAKHVITQGSWHSLLISVSNFFGAVRFPTPRFQDIWLVQTESKELPHNTTRILSGSWALHVSAACEAFERPSI